MPKCHGDTSTSFSNPNKIGDYLLEKTLGRGTFGKVKLAKHIPTGEKVAIKILKKSRIKEESDKKRVIRELKILKKVRHPNVIQLYQIIETKDKIFLIMEYAANAELYDLIIKRKRLSEKEAFDYFEQLISGIDYLHRLNIIHRDVKLENLLLTPSLKLADFGLSFLSSPSSVLQTPCGSPCYAAPEMLLNKGYIGGKVDVWSAGVVLFAMICGFLPFDEGDTTVLYEKICKGIYDIPSWLSDDLTWLIREMLKIDPVKRIAINDIRKSIWWKKWGGSNGGEGLIIGVHEIPIDADILGLMENSGVDIHQIEKDLLMNKFDRQTATYYLLFQKFLRNGGESNADLKNKNFRPKVIRDRSDSLRKEKQSRSKEKSFVETISSQAKSKLLYRIANEENNNQIKSASFHKMNKKPNSFAAYMNALEANVLKNKLKENSNQINKNIANTTENNTNTNKTTIHTETKYCTQIKKERKKTSKTLIDFGFVSERLEQEKLKSSKQSKKTKLKDILTNNFNSPLEIQNKKIPNKSNLNINNFNSPKMLKTILDDFRSNNSRKRGLDFFKSGNKQNSIEIINFNLKDISKIKINESTERNYRNIDSTENIKKYIILENDEKSIFDKSNNENKLKERYSDGKMFNDTDKIINENNMYEKNSYEKNIACKTIIENEQTFFEKNIGKTLNDNKNKTSNGYMKKKTKFLIESRVSKKKSYSYDFSSKFNKIFVDSNANRISDNQNNSVCKKKNGNDSKSYHQLFNILKATNCLKKKKKEKGITNPKERSKSKENMNNKSLSLTKTCRSNSSYSKTSKKFDNQKKQKKHILINQQNSIFLENFTSYSSIRSKTSKFNPIFKNLLLKEILLK